MVKQHTNVSKFFSELVKCAIGKVTVYKVASRHLLTTEQPFKLKKGISKISTRDCQ